MTLETINNLAWGIVAISLMGNIYIIKKKVAGFYFWSFSNTLWIFYNLFIAAIAQAVLMFICLLFCLYGIYQWNKKKEI